MGTENIMPENVNADSTAEDQELMKKKAEIMLSIIEKGKKNEYLTYNEINAAFEGIEIALEELQKIPE